MNFNFDIQAKGPVSQALLQRGINDFLSTAEFVRALPYRRNADKLDPLCVLDENCGTCSTKHALLKILAEENGIKDVRLILGIFRMSVQNTPAVAAVLSKHGLRYMPEAHNYLRIGGQILDCMKTGWSEKNFIGDLLEETEITPEQITEFKVAHHKNFLRAWLKDQAELRYTLEELWAIREECIAALSKAPE